MPRSTEERALAGRIGAHVSHSRNDVRQLTAPARRAFLDRFRHRVEAEAAERGEVLPEPEIERRTVASIRAHMAALALKRARAARERRESEERAELEEQIDQAIELDEMSADPAVTGRR